MAIRTAVRAPVRIQPRHRLQPPAPGIGRAPRLQPAMTAPSPPSLEQLSGLVERVTFHNADSGFFVLRLKVRGERDLITLVGHAPSVTPGEYASASGS